MRAEANNTNRGKGEGRLIVLTYLELLSRRVKRRAARRIASRARGLIVRAALAIPDMPGPRASCLN